MRKFLIAGMVGGIIAYFLDPNKGGKRRGQALDSLSGATKRFGNQAGEDGTLRSDPTGIQPTSWATTGGAGQDTGPSQGTSRRDNPDPDDLTLRDRVESEIFRDEETSREHININVIDGVVEVRGELPQGEIDALIGRLKGIADVKGVRSYLHTPGTPAPNKESAIEAS